MLRILRVTTVFLTLFATFALVPVAFAHPLGNFTINQYVGLRISREVVLVDYVVDMAEIPAFQEIAALDANGNSQPEASEFVGYPTGKCAALMPDLSLLLNNEPLTLTQTASAVEFPAGVGGLPTLRLTCAFQASIDLTEQAAFSFTNETFPERLGWTEIVVIPEDITLAGDYPAASPSDRLTNYPQDLLASPLDQRQVELDLIPIGAPAQNKTPLIADGNDPSLADNNDAFTRLILLEEITFPALSLALVISFIWGAMHAMTPGHGKTIVGAYLVGSRGTIKHAFYLGLTTTVTHTLGVFALGLVTLFASHYIVPEKLFPWLSLLSGLFVVGIGLNLAANRLKSSGLRTRAVSPSRILTRLQAVDAPVHQPKYILQAAHGHSHSHNHEHDHRHHEGADHSHTPPQTITWRSLLALGVSGGLIPCPSALVVLLGAIALNKTAFGLILVLAFSLGLAGALTAIGMLFIYAGKIFQRFPMSGKTLSVLPLFSALFISLIGLGILVRALLEIGVV